MLKKKSQPTHQVWLCPVVSVVFLYLVKPLPFGSDFIEIGSVVLANSTFQIIFLRCHLFSLS